MDEAMLVATQQAAWAAQSSAEAAWWALLVNALAAAGAIGALWFAIVQGGRAARFERMRAAMEITVILEGVGPLLELLTVDEDGSFDREGIDFVINEGVLTRAVEVVRGATLDHVPSTIAVSQLSLLKTFLPSLDRALRMPFSPPDLIRADLEVIREADEYLRLFRSVLLTNSWSARRELRRRF